MFGSCDTSQVDSLTFLKNRKIPSHANEHIRTFFPYLWPMFEFADILTITFTLFADLAFQKINGHENDIDDNKIDKDADNDIGNSIHRAQGHDGGQGT